MKTIIFDIETIPVEWNTLDENIQNYLSKFAESDEEKEKIKEQMALWAPTNEIVAIGVLDAETEKGAMYFQCPNKQIEEFEEDGIKYVPGTEKEILENFWKVVSFANKVVSFNGRGFDGPVVMLRSAKLRIRPSKNLLPYRYSTDCHVDLLDQLQFYGACRKFNLDMFCKFFDIDSPKNDEMNGHQVKPMFDAGEYEKIARYCAGDIKATRKLYQVWDSFLKF